MTLFKLIARGRCLIPLLAALLLSPAAQAQSGAPPNFDGLWRAAKPAITLDLDISRSASGKPVVTITRWQGTDTSRPPIYAETSSGTIEGDKLRYVIYTPFASEFVLSLKDQNEMTGIYTRSNSLEMGNTVTFDFKRK